MGGESDHTRLDLDAIRSMGSGLSGIKKAFEGLESLTHKYDEDFGHGDLSAKFNDFADNWKLSRDRLKGEVDTLAQIAKAAAKAYEDIDHQLAEAIRGAQDPKKVK
ncbi:hypothetical protein [Streptomyces griseorubiginosus]|uniref:hypothetical protein n=1 Tax=Streptomyces griseorubiginosus TaxID=67304 RepID=UPI001AD6C4FB|nr:hypothetical protein [Streptomyces griseorubiginosus]MBO4258020.1 hypothetical protein [Streptomyces griseorubiginosus]